MWMVRGRVIERVGKRKRERGEQTGMKSACRGESGGASMWRKLVYTYLERESTRQVGRERARDRQTQKYIAFR